MTKKTKKEEIMEYIEGLELDELKPEEELEKNVSALIIAPRRSGKSYLLRDIMSKIHHWYSSVYVFSMTSEVQGDIYSYVPRVNVFSEISDELLQQIWDEQSSYIQDHMSKGGKKSEANYICLIFDDFMESDAGRRSRVFQKLFTQGRHINIACFSIVQRYNGISPIIRTNTDVIFTFFMGNSDDKIKLAREFLSIRYLSDQEGLALQNKVCGNPENYQSLVILNTKKAVDHKTKCRVYNAVEPRPFTCRAEPIKVPEMHMEEAKDESVGVVNGFRVRRG